MSAPESPSTTSTISRVVEDADADVTGQVHRVQQPLEEVGGDVGLLVELLDRLRGCVAAARRTALIGLVDTVSAVVAVVDCCCRRCCCQSLSLLSTSRAAADPCPMSTRTCHWTRAPRVVAARAKVRVDALAGVRLPPRR
jgi:hypothetical protein